MSAQAPPRGAWTGAKSEHAGLLTLDSLPRPPLLNLTMVRLASIASLALLPVLGCNAQFAALEALQAKGQLLVRGVLSNVLRLNETQIERVMATTNTTLPPNDFAGKPCSSLLARSLARLTSANLRSVDLTDENYEAVLRTGTPNPLAESLPSDTVWIVTVYGPDQ